MDMEEEGKGILNIDYRMLEFEVHHSAFTVQYLIFSIQLPFPNIPASRSVTIYPLRVARVGNVPTSGDARVQIFFHIDLHVPRA